MKATIRRLFFRPLSASRSKLPVSLSKDAQMTCEQQSTDMLMKLKRLSSWFKLPKDLCEGKFIHFKAYKKKASPEGSLDKVFTINTAMRYIRTRLGGVVRQRLAEKMRNLIDATLILLWIFINLKVWSRPHGLSGLKLTNYNISDGKAWPTTGNNDLMAKPGQNRYQIYDFPNFSVSYEWMSQIYQIYKVRFSCVIFQYGNVL